MQDIICAICGIKQEKKILYKSTFSESDLNSKTYSARRYPDKIHFTLNRCNRCELIFSSPIIAPSKIKLLYKQSYCSYPQQVKYVTKTYMSLFETVSSKLPEKPRILEIGCGNGFFLKILYQKGYKDVYGVEPSKKMVTKMPIYIRRNIKQTNFEEGLYKNNTFDLVCCFHTLDHVTDPNIFLSQTYSVLKKGGIALFVVHDTNALSARILGERSPIFDIEHIYLFNQKNLGRIFSKHKFEITKIQSLSNSYPLRYWVRMSGINSGIKDTFDKILTKLRIDNLNLSLKGGNMYIIARKK